MSTGTRQITVQHPASCLSCDGIISAGKKANWVAGIGVWHTDCPEPKNLRQDLKVKEQRVALGLEAPEFGSAPILKRKDEA